jgi:hypothetical protein
MAKLTVTNVSEAAQMHALAAARRAIRAGDIVLAERWMRLAERHYKCLEHVHRHAWLWGRYRKEVAAREEAQRKAASAYRAQRAARGEM